MWACLFNSPDTSSFLTHFLHQQTEDNTNNMKEMEQRVLSLSGVLTSPVGEDDYAEKWRRSVLRRSVLIWARIGLLIHILGSLKGLL